MAECPSEFTRIAFVGGSFVTGSSIIIVPAGLNPQFVSFAVRGQSGVCLPIVRNVVPELRAGKHILKSLQITRDFVNQISVSQVVICQLYYRFRPSPFARRSSVTVRHRLPLGYNQLVDDVNRELGRLTDVFFNRVHFWKHRGMLVDFRALLSGDAGCIVQCRANVYSFV